jgi:putative autotransporter adhesin-like protein
VKVLLVMGFGYSCVFMIFLIGMRLLGNIAVFTEECLKICNMKNTLILCFVLSAAALFAQTELEPFEHIRTFGNLRVVLTQGDSYSYTANENLGDLKISVKEGKLRISHKQNEKMWSERTVVEVTYKNLQSIYASAGSEIVHEKTMEVGDFDLDFDSGAFARLTIDAQSLDVNVGEGAVLRLHGSSRVMDAVSTTGGVLKAMDFKAHTVYVRANTGGTATVYAVEKIEAKASIGGFISYFGDPEYVKSTESMGGSIR